MLSNLATSCSDWMLPVASAWVKERLSNSKWTLDPQAKYCGKNAENCQFQAVLTKVWRKAVVKSVRPIKDNLATQFWLKGLDEFVWAWFLVENVWKVDEPRVQIVKFPSRGFPGGCCRACRSLVPLYVDGEFQGVLPPLFICVVWPYHRNSGCAAALLIFFRPPGHHASHHESNGFCIYNNIAIAAQHLLKNRGAKRFPEAVWFLASELSGQNNQYLLGFWLSTGMFIMARWSFSAKLQLIIGNFSISQGTQRTFYDDDRYMAKQNVVLFGALWNIL